MLKLKREISVKTVMFRSIEGLQSNFLIFAQNSLDVILPKPDERLKLPPNDNSGKHSNYPY